MSYFGFLLIFVIVPIGVLALFLRRAAPQPARLRAFAPAAIVLIHVLVALIYTTPWDNYLVATRVWWYDPALVTGITFGWVPIEEYTFFLLQPLLSSLWLLLLMRSERLRPAAGFQPNRGLRLLGMLLLGVVWIAAVALLVGRYRPATYLALELAWALPPIMLQIGFGGDILWRQRRLLLAAWLPATLYLAAADAVAIQSGTWTIDPAQSFDLLLFGVLPIEELLFFALTNLLLVFGVTLMLSQNSRLRFEQWRSAGRPWARLAPRRLTPALLLLALWLLVMILVPIASWTAGEARMLQFVQLGVVLQLLAVVAALRLTWRWHQIATAAAAVALLALAAEAIGTASGLPFGHYQYSERLQPQIAEVPLLIPLAWFMMLPPAWAVAQRLRQRRVRFAAVSALAFTSWDLFLDPQMTGWQLWQWQQPGLYFGIPLINYAGWFLVAFAITWLLFPRLAPINATGRQLLLLIFSLTWFLESTGLALFWGQPGPALVGAIVMGFFVFYGWRGARRQPQRQVGWQA